MVKSQPLKTQTSHFKIFETFDDLLEEGKSYVLLNENSLLYQNETGKYVFLTIDPKATYSADDFMKLPEGAPFELLNGKLTYMPSPKSPHQIASGNLFSALHLFVKRNKLGIVLSAPMDVHLDNKNIFQPDILFLSNDRKSLLKDWVYGAPDLTVEIISPGSKSDDLKTKFKQYEKHGVKEYWLIDTENKSTEIFVNRKGKLTQDKTLVSEGKLASTVIEGFEIALAEIFEY